MNTTSRPPPAGQCVNESTYVSTTGSVFELFCELDWNHGDFFFGLFLDFFSCINYCAQWNLNNTIPCVAVSYSEGVYGPLGPAGGSLCALKFELLENEKHSSGTQDAVLINASANFSAHSTFIPTSGAASFAVIRVAERIMGCIGGIALLSIITTWAFL